jgi:hypothetical protein
MIAGDNSNATTLIATATNLVATAIAVIDDDSVHGIKRKPSVEVLTNRNSSGKEDSGKSTIHLSHAVSLSALKLPPHSSATSTSTSTSMISSLSPLKRHSRVDKDTISVGNLGSISLNSPGGTSSGGNSGTTGSSGGTGHGIKSFFGGSKSSTNTNSSNNNHSGSGNGGSGLHSGDISPGSIVTGLIGGGLGRLRSNSKEQRDSRDRDRERDREKDKDSKERERDRIKEKERPTEKGDNKAVSKDADRISSGGYSSSKQESKSSSSGEGEYTVVSSSSPLSLTSSAYGNDRSSRALSTGSAGNLSSLLNTPRSISDELEDKLRTDAMQLELKGKLDKFLALKENVNRVIVEIKGSRDEENAHLKSVKKLMSVLKVLIIVGY